VETLGSELVLQTTEAGKRRDPDAVVVTHAGGGNVTGTARGIIREGAKTKIIAASVNLKGLHMANDRHFNRKSFTTGHTGFGIPFGTWPDRSDMPRNAARPMRYIDQYVLVNQGEVFYMTELLANLEGLERGPAGNTSLCAAFSLAQEMTEEQIIVVQETEYTGAGKHIQPQLSFARENGVEILFGDPVNEIPGKNIILPQHPSQIKTREADLASMRVSLIRNHLNRLKEQKGEITENMLSDEDIDFLAKETNSSKEFSLEKVRAILNETR